MGHAGKLAALGGEQALRPRRPGAARGGGGERCDSSPVGGRGVIGWRVVWMELGVMNIIYIYIFVVVVLFLCIFIFIFYFCLFKFVFFYFILLFCYFIYLFIYVFFLIFYFFFLLLLLMCRTPCWELPAQGEAETLLNAF